MGGSWGVSSDGLFVDMECFRHLWTKLVHISRWLERDSFHKVAPDACDVLQRGDVNVFQGGASPQEVGIHPSDVSVSLRSSLGDSDVQPCKIIFPTRTTLTRGPTSNAVREVQQHINSWPIPVTLLRGLRSISVRVEVSLKKAHPIWVTLKAACG